MIILNQRPPLPFDNHLIKNTQLSFTESLLDTRAIDIIYMNESIAAPPNGQGSCLHNSKLWKREGPFEVSLFIPTEFGNRNRSKGAKDHAD